MKENSTGQSDTIQVCIMLLYYTMYIYDIPTNKNIHIIYAKCRSMTKINHIILI